MVRGDGLVDGFAHVVPHMPSVRDLDCIWCSRSGSFGVGTGPVPADDLRTRVILQPLGKRVCVATGQDVDRAVGVHVQRRHSAVDVTASQGEIINAQRCYRPRLR